MRNVAPVLIAGMSLGLLSALLAIGFAGAGHGTYAPAKILFPYSMALTGVTGVISGPLIALALLQYPLYAWVCSRWGATLGRRKAVGVIAALHAVAVIAAVVTADPSFTT